ncbi:MucR family transcriptional regulator [Pseudorhizobium flavum]|uniref:MucR family transcriptional regulator n=1 Tax=Pseudorhizobium flavum TaxID=1335061 RepID=UPI003CD0C967
MRKGGRSKNVLQCGARIVEAYIRNNDVPISDLPRLVEMVYSRLASLRAALPAAEPSLSALAVEESSTDASNPKSPDPQKPF